MSAQNCTTHHYACECREAKFAEIARDNETLREDLDNAHNTIRGMEVKLERIDLGNISLRDWFAGQALSSDWISDWSITEGAQMAYKYADALLAERTRVQS
mgnify:CR=1 FL=1